MKTIYGIPHPDPTGVVDETLFIIQKRGSRKLRNVDAIGLCMCVCEVGIWGFKGVAVPTFPKKSRLDAAILW